MLRKFIVLSLICYARFVTSQQTAGGGLTGTDQSQGGVPNLGGGTFPASGIQTQTGSLTGLDTPGAQTGMDFTGTQTGVDPMAGQTGIDQMPFDPTAQTGFGAAGHPTGFDQTSGGLDLTQGTGQNQQGLDQQGPIPADPLGGFPTDSPLFGVDILGGTGGTGASSDPIVGRTLLGGANPVQTIEPPHNEVAIFATSEIGTEYTFNRIIDIETQFDMGIELECPPADENDQSHVPETMVIKEPGDEDEARSSKTEQEAGNEALKQLIEGKKKGGERRKYKKPRDIAEPGYQQEVHANPEASIVPFGTSVGVFPPEDDEFLPSPAIPEPSIVPGEATSSKTEQDAGNEALKQLLEGKKKGGERRKYKEPRYIAEPGYQDVARSSKTEQEAGNEALKQLLEGKEYGGGDKSACKMLDPRQSEFGDIKIRGDEPLAQHLKGQDCSKEGDSEFQMVHQEQKHCELPSTSRGAVTPDDDQVKQTTRPPCAPEDDKAPLSKPVQETEVESEFQMVHEEQKYREPLLWKRGDIAVPQDDDQFDQTMRVPYDTEDSMYHEDCQSALTEPDLRNGEATSSKTEQEAGDKSACKMLDPRQSEFGDIKIRGDEPLAQHLKGQDCSKEGDSEFQMVHQEQKHCELPSTSRGAVAPDDDQVEQTKRTPCAPEDSMHHDDTKSALTDPDLTNTGKINFLPTVVVLDICSRTSSTEDITQSIKIIFNLIDFKMVIILLIIMSFDQKKRITKDIKNILESEENIDKLEIDRKVETLVKKKNIHQLKYRVFLQ